MGTVSVEQITYGGWEDCYRITDGVVEVVAVATIGPRLIRLGYCDGPNLFAEFPEQLGQKNGSEWQIYGGHRLWHSPESKTRTYWPDNRKVEAIVKPNGLVLKQPTEGNAGIAKEIAIELDPNTHDFTLIHRLTNQGVWPVQFAPWALSVMQTGGTAIIPQFRVADPEGLLPNRYLSLWPYTDMNDSRVTWGGRFIMINQDTHQDNPFKIGISVPEGWAAYLNQGYLLLKRFAYSATDQYPDNGVNVEVYTNHRFLELETLGGIQTVPSGATVQHIETWQLNRRIGAIRTEQDVATEILPLVK